MYSPQRVTNGRNLLHAGLPPAAEYSNFSDGILIAAKHYISAGLAEPEYALQLSSILSSGTLPSTEPAVQSGRSYKLRMRMRVRTQ